MDADSIRIIVAIAAYVIPLILTACITYAIGKNAGYRKFRAAANKQLEQWKYDFKFDDKKGPTP